MTRELNKEDKWLAAEFALGGLDRENMQKAEQRYDRDQLFRHEVDGWNNQLSPILDEVTEVSPRSEVWDAIAQRTSVATGNQKTGLWSSLSFWRGLSIFSSGLAIASIAALLYFPGSGFFSTKTTSPMVATLNAKGDAPTLLASFSPDDNVLILRTVLPKIDQAKVAELWLIPSDGVPRSLGLLDNASMQFKLSDNASSLMSDGGTLAISLEPEGGSPTGAPTGPVIASGKLRSF